MNSDRFSVESGLPNNSAAFDIKFILSGDDSMHHINSSIDVLLLPPIAAPLLIRNSIFLSSWPGIGFVNIKGSFLERASETVIPPGLVTIQSAASIISGMSVVKPNSLILCLKSVSDNLLYVLVLFPHIATI